MNERRGCIVFRWFIKWRRLLYLVALVLILCLRRGVEACAYLCRSINYALYYTESPIYGWFCDDDFWGRLTVGFCVVLLIVVAIIENKMALKKGAIDVYDEDGLEPFVYDTPAKQDLMGREWHARMLVRKIFKTFYAKSDRAKENENTESSFVIHLGENFGMGKTTFIKMIKKELRASNNDYVPMDFKPWLCDNAAGILREFFLELRECLREAGVSTLDDTMKKYAKALLSGMTIGTSCVMVNIKVLVEKQYSLRELHDNVAKGLREIGKPVIISIDDVDRLDGDEVMMVMKIIRDTADFPDIFYIVAADNTRLREALRAREVADPDQFLKKFFNLEYQLPANDNVAFKMLKKCLVDKIEKYSRVKISKDSIIAIIDAVEPIINYVIRDVRDVKRFLNIYYLYLDTVTYMEEETGRKIDLDDSDSLMICLLKFVDPEYYTKLRDYPFLLFDYYNIGSAGAMKWKEELNIPRKRKNEESLKQKKEVGKKAGIDMEEHRISTFEETTESIKYNKNEAIMSIMNQLFGEERKWSRSDNRIYLVNMYYRYFSFEQADYMVDRLEVDSMFSLDEKDFANKLDEMFEEGKNEAFIGEFTFLVTNTERDRISTLRRLFIYVWTAYKHQKWMRNYQRYYGFSKYLNEVFPEQELMRVVYGLYSKRRRLNDEAREEAVSELQQFCVNYMEDDMDGYFMELREAAIDMLLKVTSELYSGITELIFSNDEIGKMRKDLFSRFLNKRLLQGWLDDDKVSTLYALKGTAEWEDMLRERLKSDNNFCLNFLSSLLILSENGSQVYPDDLLAHIITSVNNSDGGKLIDELKQANPGKEEILENMVNIINQSNSKNLEVKEISPDSDKPFVKFVREHRLNHGGFRRSGKREETLP